MEISCRLNQQMMEWLPGVLVPGRSEAAVSWDIEMFFRHHGATELAFTSIVGHGPNAALPHYLPSKDALLEAENLVLVDVGCRLEDYCSDQTRTFWVGEKPTERFKKTLEAVQEAQHKAIRAIHPGVLACDVYKAARGTSSLSALPKPLRMGSGMASDWKPMRGRALMDVIKPRWSPE